MAVPISLQVRRVSGLFRQEGKHIATYAGNTVKRGLRPEPGTTVAIGDSITAWDGDGNSLRQRDTWFQQLCARTNQRIRYGGVFATGSIKLSDIRATHLPSVLALDPAPAACFIFGGTNTETAGVAAGFPILTDIAQQLEAKGVAPVLVTLLPRSDANNTNHQNWNNGLRTLAAKRGWLIYDPAPALLTAAGALNTALYADSAPAIHPVRPAGHAAMAKRGVSDDLASAFPKMRLTSKEADSANNLLPFNTGLFLTDTDANGLADNWSPAGTKVTYSLIAPTTAEDIVGNWQRVARTTGGATSTVMQRSASSGFAAGDRVALSGRFKATVGGTGSTYTIQAQWTGAPGTPHSLEPIYTWQHDNDGTFLRGSPRPRRNNVHQRAGGALGADKRHIQPSGSRTYAFQPDDGQRAPARLGFDPGLLQRCTDSFGYC